MCVFNCEWESHICMMCDFHTPHALTCFTAVLCRTYEKWGNIDLFLALKSTCCNEASGLCVVSDHLTHAQAVDFKDTSLSLAGRCDGAVKRDE